MMRRLTLSSPLGPLTLTEDEGAIVALDWGAIAAFDWSVDGGADSDGDPTPTLLRARDQLGEYFARRRCDFDLELAPRGTPFQRAVWERMGRVPYGHTESYGALARDLATGARAVGTACGRNPIPIVVPCHRIVGGGGGLGGYSGHGGVATKRRLLDLEAGGAG